MLLFNLLGTTHATSLVLGTSMCDDLACASKHTGLKVLASLILISCVGSREASKTCRAVCPEEQGLVFQKLLFFCRNAVFR